MCFMQTVSRLEWHPQTVDVCEHCIHWVCVREGRGCDLRRSVPPDWRLMDILARSTGHNKERKVGVFFPRRRWLVAAETGRGRAVYPGAQFLCYLSHCFYLHCTQSSWGCHGTKTEKQGCWHSVTSWHLGLQLVMELAGDAGVPSLCFFWF